jgi:hypothetical protein
MDVTNISDYLPKSRIEHLTAVFYAVFMAGFFLVPNAVDQFKLYGVTVFVISLLLLPRTLPMLRTNPLLLLMIAYLLWMLAATFWSLQASTEVFFKTLRLACYIASFVLVTYYLVSCPPVRPQLSKDLVV